MACSYCGRDKRIAAKGLCSACYSRQRYYGSLERKNAVNKGKLCKVRECKRPAIAKGWCTFHYTRSQHPLRTIWRLIRSRSQEGEVPETWSDFNKFLEDVGERPSADCQLRRIDPTKPYSKKNVKWSPPVIDGGSDNRAEYSRAWNFKRKFNITVSEYDRMLEEQGGVCAICGNGERSRSYHTQKRRALSVDHCHRTEEIRELLCNRCNRLLGLAQDDTDLLEKCIAYLKKHGADVP